MHQSGSRKPWRLVPWDLGDGSPFLKPPFLVHHRKITFPVLSAKRLNEATCVAVLRKLSPASAV